MSKIIASAVIRGAHKITKQAEDILARAIEEKGKDCRVEFPNTGYYMPIIYSMTGQAVEKLSDFQEVMQEVKGLLPPLVDDELWLPYLGQALDAGMATLFAEEVIEGCKYLIGPNPVDNIWLGAADDVILRERGIQFVDGTAPGFAAIAGAAPDVKTAVEIARKLQQLSLYVFLHGHNNGTTFAEQLVEGGVQLGWETRLIPFGREITSAVYALGFASRAAMSFGESLPLLWPWVRSLTNGTPTLPVQLTTAFLQLLIPIYRRFCRPACAHTSTWSQTFPTTRLLKGQSKFAA
jgi:acetyl-CoA synthase